MADNDAPRAGPVWTPGPRLAEFIKRITIHCYIQNMKALGLVVSEKKIFFYVLPMTPPGRGPYGPQGQGWQIYKEDHYTLLHTKYESSGPCGFGVDDFLCFLMTPPGRGPYGPVAQLAGFIKRTTIYCYTQNLGHVVLEKKIF